VQWALCVFQSNLGAEKSQSLKTSKSQSAGAGGKAEGKVRAGIQHNHHQLSL